MALQWDATELHLRELQFHRGSGLLDGGILVLALFTLIAGLINRNRTYVLFAAWLVVNLRMAALSMGWDQQWLGHTIPYEWLQTMRPLTLALYYVVTFTLFVSLMRDELAQIGHAYLSTAIKWSCLPLLLLCRPALRAISAHHMGLRRPQFTGFAVSSCQNLYAHPL
ncbi:MAG: hypothetical protein M1359_06205 [Betaproteobacteria bacterium]|nr:hypothetical protein [Betaproteobacteria bacterium]